MMAAEHLQARDALRANGMLSPEGFLCLYTRTDRPEVMKIGWARNPFLRAAVLRVGNDNTLGIKFWHAGSLRDKYHLHRRFAAYRTEREWFIDTDGLIRAYFCSRQHQRTKTMHPPGLQDRYSVARNGQPTLVPLEDLTEEELDEIVERLSAEANSALRHADALEVEASRRAEGGFNSATIRTYGAGPTEVRTVDFDKVPSEIRNNVLRNVFAIAAAYGMGQLDAADQDTEMMMDYFCKAVEAMEACGELTYEPASPLSPTRPNSAT